MNGTTRYPREEVTAAVCGIIAEALNRPVDFVTPEKILHSGLGVDSMVMIDSHVRIEERFGIVMPDIDELIERKIKSVNDLVDVVMDELGAEGR